MPQSDETRNPAPKGSGVFRAPGQFNPTAKASGIAQDSSSGGGAGGAGPNFTDHGGTIIQNVQVQLIFWGAAWNNNTPSVGAVTDAVMSIMTGPYMNSLSQYRGIGSGTLIGTSVVNTAVGGSLANPPNPFTNTDIENLITNLYNAGRVPNPANSQLFYCVILPPNVNNSAGNFIGEHTYYLLSGQNAHYAWVMNNGTLNFVTSIFSHELVEAVTDPEGSAILGDVGSCNQTGWCEIGDVCTGNTAIVNGVTVQRYWSQFDKACVVPTDAIVKTDKDSKDKDKEQKEHKESKDSKDHKETKDGAKEKDKDALEKTRDVPAKVKEAENLPTVLDQLLQRMDQLGARVEQIAQELAQGKAFISPKERPPVGEQALDKPEKPRKKR